ncbi:MAG: selenoneine synthase SenA [Burkholderiales bacterium]|jgi:iron(II)-dependent oxidoreductase
MHARSIPADATPRAHDEARCAGAAWLAGALRASRADTLSTFEAYRRALPDLAVPLRAGLNPPLWEIGHVGWFQDFWIGRNPGLAQGPRADPAAPRRAPAGRPDADALYHSSFVAHASRWSLALPSLDETLDTLAAQLDRTLARLAEAGDGDDDALYFFRLALLHEDMHHEAALYMAEQLDLPIESPGFAPAPMPEPPPPIVLDAGSWRLGEAAPGFAFDNELGAHDAPAGPVEIDAQSVRWAEYLPFVETGGYRDPRLWSEAGLRWLRETGASGPAALRHDGHAGWMRRRSGRRVPLDVREAACHLNAHEAEAWCRWAGRRLPTEAEWERAAVTHPDTFRRGDVWEWTASAFEPFPGFVAHPYRDYSAPWFDGRPVLRGGSWMTQPRVAHPRYRNFFQPWRTDVPAGLRSASQRT